MHRARFAFTLIELLMCVAIISILSGIGYYCYASALEGAAVKLALPFLAEQIGHYQYEATKEKTVIVVECPEGQETINVTKKGPKGITRETIGLDRRCSLGRRLLFRRYRWPDGKAAPRTFTFIPRESPKGGTVWFGTGMAEGQIMILGNRISWSQ